MPLSSTLPITLLRVTAGNPFATHPQLRQIWHASLQPHVEADTVADLTRGDDDPARNLVYLVMQQGTAVGITGVYDLGEHDLGLRWHGIVPAARHGGLSGQAFQAVLGQARRERPERRRIVEYIEMRDPNANRLIAHFATLGFRRDGPAQDAARFPAECALPERSGDWQAMVVDQTARSATLSNRNDSGQDEQPISRRASRSACAPPAPTPPTTPDAVPGPRPTGARV